MTTSTSVNNTSPITKILITGASGYLGQHLIASLALLGVAPSRSANNSAGKDIKNDGRHEIYCAYNSLPTFEDDLNDFLGLASDTTSRLHPSISKVVPLGNIDFSSDDYMAKIQNGCGGSVDVIVHLAALSSPGYCENNPKDAWKVNCPLELYRFSLEVGAPIIYVSTDQVYEGTKKFYVEDIDETLPVNVYGRTKLAFERVLLGKDPLLNEREMGGSEVCREHVTNFSKIASPLKNVDSNSSQRVPKSIILRSSLILGPPTPLKNGCKKGSFPSFLQFIHHRLETGQSTDYFVNEFRSVVFVEDVIDSIRHFLNNSLNGDSDDVSAEDSSSVFNMGGSTRASRVDMAMAVANHLKLDPSSINGVIRPENNGGGVPSPPDISMNVDKLAKELGRDKMHGLTYIVAMTFDSLLLQDFPPLYRYAAHKLDRSHIHTTFSASHAPKLRIKPGELVHVETWDCFHGAYFKKCDKVGQDDSTNDYLPLPIPSPEEVSVNISNWNPVTGPIFVDGAKPGDILSITIHDIRPKLHGVASNYGPGAGQLGRLVTKSCIRYFEISNDRTSVVMQCDRRGRSAHRAQNTNNSLPEIKFPCRPMLGVIGLAPKGELEISTMPAGKHGGNLDNKINTIGSTIHIPVNHPGALLSIGDMHASQGDGEICGTGVEVSGDVLLSCSITGSSEIAENEYPITETKTHWVTHGVAVEDIPRATTIASEEAALLLTKEWGFSMEDACVFLGVAGDLGLCQAIHPDKGTVIAKMSVPKIEACPRPYRRLKK